METKNKYSDWLREKREAVELSQSEVARRLGYTSPQLISNFERGISMPPARALDTLADIYGQDREQFLETYLDSLLERYKGKLIKKLKQSS